MAAYGEFGLAAVITRQPWTTGLLPLRCFEQRALESMRYGAFTGVTCTEDASPAPQEISTRCVRAPSAAHRSSDLRWLKTARAGRGLPAPRPMAHRSGLLGQDLGWSPRWSRPGSVHSRREANEA